MACYEARVLRFGIGVLALSALLSLGSCGGSSSETPFPLEPDLSRLDGGPTGQARYIVYSGDKQRSPEGEGTPQPEEPDEPPPPGK